MAETAMPRRSVSSLTDSGGRSLTRYP